MKKILLVRRVVGKSMLPVLRPGQLVLATGLFSRLTPECVVIINHDSLEKIKRLQKVRRGRVFVVGDNSRASLDSRSFGWLPASSVVAKVLWPKV